MKRIVILGCENSHANNFLDEIKSDAKYSEYEVVGIYSDEPEAVQKLSEKYGVKIMNSPDEAVGKVDCVIVTARHGDNHYKYAKPYIKSGVPMFIDKPITISADEAVRFMRELRDNGVRVTGGSSLRQAAEIKQLKADAEAGVGGETLGGVVRAPLSSASPYGGFFFYAQHLAEMVMEIFGRYPKSVRAFESGNQKTVIFRYESYDVAGLYTDEAYVYYAARFAKNESKGFTVGYAPDWFKNEFADIDALISGGEQQMSYDDFIAPVFVLNAIKASLDDGEEKQIEYIGV